MYSPFPFIKPLGTFLGILALALPVTLAAQNHGVPLEEFLSRKDKEHLDEQAQALYQKFDKITTPFGSSVVYVCRSNRVVALGTVVAPGKILTKWSDLNARGALAVVYENEIYDTRVLGGDQQHDLVLLECPSLKAPSLDFSRQSKAEEGDFLLTVLPGGSTGEFGILSVPARSLREEDIPYLGITASERFSDDGTVIENVDPESGAGKAGIQPGDTLVKLNNQKLSGPLSILASLKEKKPGELVNAVVKRNNELVSFDVTLSSRPRQMRFPERRLEDMNRVGNPMSRRRDNFPYVIQSDMTLNPAHGGAPVVDLDGKVVGLALSRAGRTETYILPASLIADSVKAGIANPAEVSSPNESEADSRKKQEEDLKTQKYADDLRTMQHDIQKAEVVED